MAIRLFEAAVKSCPSDAFSWDGLGISLCRGGRALEGLKALDHAIALEPNQPDHHYNRARALELLSRREEALNADRRAEQLRAVPASPLAAPVPSPPQDPSAEFQWGAPAAAVTAPYNTPPPAYVPPPYYQPSPQRSGDDGARVALIVIGSVAGAVVLALVAFGVFWVGVVDNVASRQPAVATPRYPAPPRIVIPDPPRYQAPEIRIPDPPTYHAPQIRIPDPPQVRVPEVPVPETPRIRIPDRPEIHVPSPPVIHIDPPQRIDVPSPPHIEPLGPDRFPRPPMPRFPTFQRPGFSAPDSSPTFPSSGQGNSPAPGTPNQGFGP
jgi:hypothetical protein